MGSSHLRLQPLRPWLNRSGVPQPWLSPNRWPTHIAHLRVVLTTHPKYGPDRFCDRGKRPQMPANFLCASGAVIWSSHPNHRSHCQCPTDPSGHGPAVPNRLWVCACQVLQPQQNTALSQGPFQWRARWRLCGPPVCALGFRGGHQSQCHLGQLPDIPIGAPPLGRVFGHSVLQRHSTLIGHHPQH